jgi:hypothetical protein
MTDRYTNNADYGGSNKTLHSFINVLTPGYHLGASPKGRREVLSEPPIICISNMQCMFSQYLYRYLYRWGTVRSFYGRAFIPGAVAALIIAVKTVFEDKE